MKKKIIFLLGIFTFYSCGNDLTQFYIKCLPLKAPYQLNWYLSSSFGGFSVDHLELYNQETKQCKPITSCTSIHDLYLWGDSVVILIDNRYYDTKTRQMVESKEPCSSIDSSVFNKMHYGLVIRYGQGGANADTRLRKIREISRDTCFTMHFINTDP